MINIKQAVLGLICLSRVSKLPKDTIHKDIDPATYIASIIYSSPYPPQPQPRPHQTLTQFSSAPLAGPETDSSAAETQIWMDFRINAFAAPTPLVLP